MKNWEEGSSRQRKQTARMKVKCLEGLGSSGRPVRSGRNERGDVYGQGGQEPGHFRPHRSS